MKGGGEMFKTFFKWLRSKKKDIVFGQKQIAHESPPTSSDDAEQPQIVPYDENLLECSRTQWQFGDWESLAQLERETLQHHPDRAKLALLAGAGHLQLGNMPAARQFVRVAQDWGCSKKMVSQILVAGVHNSLGRASSVAGQQPRALQHFESAIATGTPGSEVRLITQARIKEQHSQLDLLTIQFSLPHGTVPLAPTFIEKHASEMMQKDLHIRINEELINRESNKFPKEDLVNEIYDTKEKVHTTDIIVIFSTPRSGSTLLCDLLMKNNICLAHEYFQPYQYMPILAKRWQCIWNDELNIAEYVRSLCDKRTLANGWLGINLHGTHIEIFQRLSDYFPPCNFHYIHLVRKDLLGQAISYVIAQQTGKWSSYYPSVNEPKYDFDAINRRLKDIAEANLLIESYLSTQEIDCQKVFYEDLTEDTQLFFLTISHIIPGSLAIKVDTSLTRQATVLNAEWRGMYEAELCRGKNHKKIGLLEFN